MASTTNFGWSTPDNTGLVKDGAQDIRTLGSAIDTTMGELKGGTTGQVLAKTSATDMDFTWTTPSSGGSPATPTTEGTVYGNTSDFADINSSFGKSAGESITTGTRNTLLGALSGQYLTSASNNTAVGGYALNGASSGDNTAVGADALKSISTGASNTALGSGAAAQLDGTQNTAIGAYADYNGYYGSNNTVIGYNAQKSGNSVNNEITLGNASVDRLRVPGVGLDTAAGTTGQALVKTGANTVGWATVGGGGGGSMTVLATGSITSNTLSLTGFPTDYKDIRIIISSLRGYGRARVNPSIYPASNPSAYYTVSEIITTSYNNGASSTIGNYYGDGGTQMRFSYNPTTGDTDSFSGNAYRTSAVINIYNNDVTSYAKLFDCTLQGWNSSGGASEVLQTNGTAYLQTSSEVDRIDGLGFNFGLDGSQSGTYTVYGIK